NAERLITSRTFDVAVCCSSASASFFFRSALAARRRATSVLVFVLFERRPIVRLPLFAPLRAKITSRQVGSAAKDSTPRCGSMLHCGILGPSLSAMGLVSRVTPVQTALRNCTRDEGRSFEVGNQVLISSHRKLLLSKAMVVNVAETSGLDSDRHG